MRDWALWAIAAAVLAAGEVFTLSFFLGPVALAALLAGAVAAAGASLGLQFAVFAVGSAASLLFIRPIARRHLRTPAHARTGTTALIGAPAVVLERVDGQGGQVKLAGEVWTARSYDEDETFEEGRRVEVIEIEGATALIAD